MTRSSPTDDPRACKRVGEPDDIARPAVWLASRPAGAWERVVAFFAVLLLVAAVPLTDQARFGLAVLAIGARLWRVRARIVPASA